MTPLMVAMLAVGLVNMFTLFAGFFRSPWTDNGCVMRLFVLSGAVLTVLGFLGLMGF